MLDLVKTIETTISPLLPTSQVLDTAYELYLEAPESSHPVIDLRELSRRTGKSLLECRNAVVSANRCGRFPNCTLQS